jgi:hypothetical protein
MLVLTYIFIDFPCQKRNMAKVVSPSDIYNNNYITSSYAGGEEDENKKDSIAGTC